MFKMVLKIIKWFCLFWVFLVVSGICTGLIGGLLAGIFGIDINIDVMLFGLTAIFMAEAWLKSRKKQKAKAKKAAATAEAASAKAAEQKMKNETAVRLDAYRVILDRQARRIKDRPTAVQVKEIASTLNKIAREVEEDPRDRSKVRSLSEHSAGMICDLVDKYLKLESQEQASSNIASTMWEIRSALETVDKSLKTLLDDLFSNDVVEVAANISVLENILAANNPENRIRMDDIGKADLTKAAETVKTAETAKAAETSEAVQTPSPM